MQCIISPYISYSSLCSAPPRLLLTFPSRQLILFDSSREIEQPSLCVSLSLSSLSLCLPFLSSRVERRTDRRRTKGKTRSEKVNFLSDDYFSYRRKTKCRQSFPLLVRKTKLLCLKGRVLMTNLFFLFGGAIVFILLFSNVRGESFSISAAAQQQQVLFRKAE
jgi:hypothetical protein